MREVWGVGGERRRKKKQSDTLKRDCEVGISKKVKGGVGGGRAEGRGRLIKE